MPLPGLCVGLVLFLLLVVLVFCVLHLRQIYDSVVARILHRPPALLGHSVIAASCWNTVEHR